VSEDQKSAWQKYKENLGETRPWDLLKPEVEKATPELALERFTICKQCPELIKLTKQCKKCGCLMKLKVELQKATCPLGKW
jgi:hypothetical protein